MSQATLTAAQREIVHRVEIAKSAIWDAMLRFPDDHPLRRDFTDEYDRLDHLRVLTLRANDTYRMQIED